MSVDAAVRAPLPWYRQVVSVFVIVGCVAMGAYLIVAPWRNEWEINRAPLYAAWLEDIWGNPYFRGALTGLGLLDLYIAASEVVKLFRG